METVTQPTNLSTRPPGPTTDYRDLLIRDQATELVELADQRDVYRLLAQGAIHALHKQTEDALRLRQQLQSLRDEHRQLQAWVDHQHKVAA